MISCALRPATGPLWFSASRPVRIGQTSALARICWHNEVVKQTFSVETSASPDRLFEVLSDLTTYADWLDVVSDVSPVPGQSEPSAWLVTLRAKIGPLARSKRLRMIQSESNAETRTVLFERQETDDRTHSRWALAAAVTEANSPEANVASAATLDLHYDGSMWSGPLGGVLDGAADRATVGLQRYVDEAPDS